MFVVGSIRRTGVAKESCVAIVFANEEIKIAVIINIGQGWVGVVANIRYLEWRVSTFLDVSRIRRETALVASRHHPINHQIRIDADRAGFTWFRDGEDGWVAYGIGDGAAIDGECC